MTSGRASMTVFALRCTPFCPVGVPLDRYLGALQFPRFRQSGQGGTGPRRVVRLVVMQRRVDVFRYDRGQHVQHLVSLVAGVRQPFRCLPHLGRFVRQELVGDNLVHRDVECRVHDLATMMNRFSSGGECRPELGMFGTDQHRAFVVVVRVEKAELDAVELAAETQQGEPPPLVIVHASNASFRVRRVSSRDPGAPRRASSSDTTGELDTVLDNALDIGHSGRVAQTASAERR